MTDVVNHPSHYTAHPSGVECITVTEHMGFNLGNAVKYIWRADEKGKPLEDLRKALFYVEREIARREAQQVSIVSAIDVVTVTVATAEERAEFWTGSACPCSALGPCVNHL